jgi:hypothetical protein
VGLEQQHPNDWRLMPTARRVFDPHPSHVVSLARCVLADTRTDSGLSVKDECEMGTRGVAGGAHRAVDGAGLSGLGPHQRVTFGHWPFVCGISVVGACVNADV